MKKLVTLIIPLILAVSACDTNEPGVEPRPIDLILEEVYKNQEILNTAFAKGGVHVGAGDITNIKGESKSKREFISKMTELTRDFMIEAIEETQSNTAGTITFTGLEWKDTTPRLLSLLTGGGEEPLPDYYSLLTNELKKISPPDWILIKNYRNAVGKEIPLEEMSLNFAQLSAAIKFTDLLISSASDQEQAEAIEAFAVKENIPPVLVGLLLPAIQKMHEETTENDPLKEWLDSALGESNSGSDGLDRDIIRRFKAAGMLAGVDQIINSRYDNANQHSASAHILRANFEATMMFAWAEVWDRMEE